MTEHLKRIPELKILIVFIFFALGILSMEIFPFGVSVFFYFIGIIYACLSKKTIAIVMVVCFILGGVDYFSYRLLDRNNIATTNLKKIKSVSGTVVTNIEKQGNSYIFYLNVNNIKTDRQYKKTGKIIVYSKKEENILKGDVIEIESFFFPISHSSNKFDYGTYMERQDVYVATSINEKSKINVIKKSKPSILLKTKNFIVNTYKNHIDKDVSKLLMGMVLGKGNYLDTDTYNNFINTGTLHLLAASGLNCFVLSVTVFYFFAFVPIKYRYVLTIIIIWFYCALIGFPASVIRAALMCSIFIFGKLIKKSTSYKHILFLSGFIFLLFSPKSLFDVGFQLSYLCLIGLLYVCPLLNRPFFRKKFRFLEKHPEYEFLVDNIYMPFIMSITSVIGINVFVLPISIYYFNYASLVSLWTNIVIGFMASVIFFMSIFFLLFQYVPIVNIGFVYVINYLGKLILKIVNYCGELNFATINIGTNIGLLTVYYIVMFLLFFYLNENYVIKKREKLKKYRNYKI